MCALVVFGGLDPDYTSSFFIGGCNVTLENILQFFSGTNKDLPQVLIVLLLPCTSTCGLNIVFPRSMGCHSYEDFEFSVSWDHFDLVELYNYELISYKQSVNFTHI